MIEAIFYLLAITSAELVTVFGNPLWGIAVHGVIMVLLLMHWAVGPWYLHRSLLLPLALVPLVRIISQSMPLTNIPQIWWYPVVYIPLLVATIVVVYLRSEDAELREVGLSFGFVPIDLNTTLIKVIEEVFKPGQVFFSLRKGHQDVVGSNIALVGDLIQQFIQALHFFSRFSHLLLPVLSA